MNRGFFLGGTSSILRTFRAGPVKKTPCMLPYQNEFNQFKSDFKWTLMNIK